MARRLRVRLAGRGGQGIMLAGFLLAEAGMRDGLEVVQTQSYGPEARLGAAKSDVIISDQAIAYPEIVRADVLLCLSGDAYDAYGLSVRDGGVCICDERVQPDDANGEDDGVRRFVLPLTRSATEAGSVLATNVVALGVLVGMHDVVSERSLREALAGRIVPGALPMNIAAFDAGLRLAATLDAGLLVGS